VVETGAETLLIVVFLAAMTLLLYVSAGWPAGLSKSYDACRQHLTHLSAAGNRIHDLSDALKSTNFPSSRRFRIAILAAADCSIGVWSGADSSASLQFDKPTSP
jgi:hypothetical protein